MKKRLTLLRFITAIVTMALEQAAIWAVWRWLLPYWGVNPGAWVVILAMLVWFAAGIFLFIIGTDILDKKEVSGLSSMIGVEGTASGRLAPEGTVKLLGELWSARAEGGNIEPGENIIVTGEDGLKLTVRKANR